MKLASQSIVLRNESGEFAADERAELAWRLAKQLEKAGEYEAAREALHEFWPQLDQPPKVDQLHDVMKAEVLLRVGALAGWLGGANQTDGSQETAKNLITKAIEMFETLAQVRSVAEARGDLALCYWREGSYDEARINLTNALNLLDSDDQELKAILLIRAGIVETDSNRLNEALRLYNEAAPLVEHSDNDALKGSFHMAFAVLFRRLAVAESREDFFDQALIENAAASFYHEKAGNTRYLARVENNLGFLYFTIGRYQDAHEHLDRARKLFIKLKDVGTAAQVDETRARTMLAEGRVREAERMIKGAIKVLENGGQQAVLAEALTTQGTIVARLGHQARAALLLQRAIVVAETVGDREGSGRAHLTIVEELGGQTPLKQLTEVYGSAADLLDQSQDPATNKRLIACARKIINALLSEQRESPEMPEGSWDGFSMRKEIEKIERALVKRALRDAGGSVSKASKLLGFHHHQSLISLINNRHRELLPQRSLVRRRHRHLFSEPQRSKKKTAPIKTENQFAVLHVEDYKPAARMVRDALGSEYHVESCANGSVALEFLRTRGRLDVLIVDNNLPGISGLELVLRVRSIVHRRNLPIIMLARDDVEKEAWRAGVDAFVQKNEAISQLPSTVARLLNERRGN